MDTPAILSEVRKEIARLEKVAGLLEDSGGTRTRRGKRKPMSPEGRAKISAAQKARWAKVRKAKVRKAR